MYAQNIIMKSAAIYIELLRQFKKNRAFQYGIKQLVLFGSVARGEEKEGSDVDICVELESPSLFNMVHIKEELQNLLSTQVDIVRLRTTMNTVLRKRIENEGLNI